MSKMLSFGTLFKNQNDPLKLFSKEESKPAAVDNSASELLAKQEADTANAEAATKASQAAYDTEVDLAKKKKGTALTSALGLNV